MTLRELSTELSELIADYDKAVESVTALIAERDYFRDRVFVLAAEIVELEARIVELEAGTTPTARILIGAAVDRQDGETMRQALARFEGRIGTRIDVHRAFASRWKTWSIHDAASSGGRTVVYSVKGSGNWDEMLASFPTDQTIYLIAPPHEVDRPDRGIGRTEFMATCDAMIAAIRRSGKTNVIPSICVTSYRERDKTPTPGYETSARWFPTDPEPWVLLLDPYDEKGVRTLPDLYTPTLDVWTNAGGNRWGIAEVSSHRTGRDLANWITEGFRAAEEDGAEVIAWFDSFVGQTAGVDGWLLRDPDGIAAFRAFIESTR